MTARLLTGDALSVLRTLPDGSARCCVTSPPEVLAYLAGVIDSDGTIGIKRQRSYSGGDQPVYSERVCVKQVEAAAVDLLHETFGGYRGRSGPSATRGRDLEVWQVTDKKAFACVVALLPYLRIKADQARNCIALRGVKEQSKKARVAFGRGHAGAASRPAHLSDAMENLRTRAKQLNAVGKDYGAR